MVGRSSTPVAAHHIDPATGRRRVSQGDIALFHALVGGGSIATQPVKRAIPSTAAANLAREPGVARAKVQRSARGQRTWSPKVLCLHLAGVCSNGLHHLPERARRPEVETWMRRVSEEARQMLAEMQSRFSTGRGKRG